MSQATPIVIKVFRNDMGDLRKREVSHCANVFARAFRSGPVAASLCEARIVGIRPEKDSDIHGEDGAARRAAATAANA